MNRIMCEFLGVSEHKRQIDGGKYYSVRFLTDNRISVCFFRDAGLFEKLSNLDRLADICLLGEFKVRDDHSFIFVPQNFEI